MEKSVGATFPCKSPSLRLLKCSLLAPRCSNLFGEPRNPISISFPGEGKNLEEVLWPLSNPFGIPLSFNKRDHAWETLPGLLPSGLTRKEFKASRLYDFQASKWKWWNTIREEFNLTRSDKYVIEKILTLWPDHFELRMFTHPPLQWWKDWAWKFSKGDS